MKNIRSGELPETRKGVSLLIAIVYVAAFMLLFAGLAQANLRALQSIRNNEESARVRRLIQSVQDTADFWSGRHGYGENTSNAVAVFSSGLRNVFLNPTNTFPLVGTTGSPQSNVSEAESYLAPLLRVAERLGSKNCQDLDIDNDPDSSQPCVGFAVLGRAASQVQLNGGNFYSVPAPFTGDAEEDEDVCKSSTNADANSECHWNKLKLGEAVEIPLYYTDGGEVKKLNLSNDGVFKLRVRAPTKTANINCLDRSDSVNSGCINSPAAGDEDRRIMLYPQPDANNNQDYLTPDKDPVLIQWLISDSAPNGTSTLLARDAKAPPKFEKRFELNDITQPNYLRENTELSAGRINAATETNGNLLKDYIVLEADYKGKGLEEKNGQGNGTLINNFSRSPPHPHRPAEER